jgi:predicted Zn finger-like uncharacterized protein
MHSGQKRLAQTAYLVSVWRLLGYNSMRGWGARNTSGATMRLICPNCGAQYEIESSLIPASGRDVQCSNCGHTWFQRQSGDGEDEFEAGPAPAPRRPEPPAPRAPAAPVAEPPAAAARAPDQPEADEDEDEGEDNGPDIATADERDLPVPARGVEAAPPREAAEPRQHLDDSLRNILREEAERESQARKAEQPIETQGDLGLPDSGDRTSAARDRMARLRGLDVDERAGNAAAAVAAATANGSRRDLLPDIEEINSSLRAAESAGRADKPGAETSTRGFKRSFTITVAIFAILVMLYVYSGQIARAVPALEPFLARYVDYGNALRVALEDGTDQVLMWLTRLLAGQ